MQAIQFSCSVNGLMRITSIITVKIDFALPINHSYKCPYGSRTVSYCASFVASSLWFFFPLIPFKGK